jgi:transposase
VANTLLEQLHGLLSYFKHRITNALAESLNGCIASLKAAARGFRNFDHYRVRILFCLAAPDLMPASKPCT